MGKHFLYLKPRAKFSDVITRTFASTSSTVYVEGKRFESKAVDELRVKQKEYLDEYFSKKD